MLLSSARQYGYVVARRIARPHLPWRGADPNGVARFASAVARYQQLLAEGTLEENELQMRVLKRLDRLAVRVVDHEATVQEYDSLIAARLQSEQAEADNDVDIRNPPNMPDDPRHRTPRGVYLWGGVGTGKSLCMDLFFDSCELPNNRKRRVHFHNFMLDVHSQIHAFKHGNHPTIETPPPKDCTREEAETPAFIIPKHFGKLDLSSEADALLQVAKAMAAEYKLLCFDEFQVGAIGVHVNANVTFVSVPLLISFDVADINASVNANANMNAATLCWKLAVVISYPSTAADSPTAALAQVTDIADALLMNKLFRTLLSHGTVVVATSNRPIEDLYAGGLNRQYFLPFLSMFQRFMLEIHVNIDRDYRLWEVGSCLVCTCSAPMLSSSIR